MASPIYNLQFINLLTESCLLTRYPSCLSSVTRSKNITEMQRATTLVEWLSEEILLLNALE